jgi:hypothetical protein
MGKPEATTPEERAQRRAKARTDMMWHLAAFAIINIFLWSLDIFTGGTTWAFWITAGWGIGLAFHAASYLIEERPAGRTYHKYLAEERQRESENEDTK